MSALSALEEECAELSRAAGEFRDADFARPTRCTAWDVKALLGHIYGGVARIDEYLDRPAPAEATHDSVTYWRAYVPAEDAPEIADRAQQHADAFGSGEDLVAAWGSLWPGTLERAAAEAPDRVVSTWGPALELEEYLRTRVLEVTVHRMDLEDAFGRKCWGTDEAVGIVDEILVDLLGKEPPHELDWDAVDFIETGCGRRSLTDEERELLGVRAAKRFPLIG